MITRLRLLSTTFNMQLQANQNTRLSYSARLTMSSNNYAIHLGVMRPWRLLDFTNLESAWPLCVRWHPRVRLVACLERMRRNRSTKRNALCRRRCEETRYTPYKAEYLLRAVNLSMCNFLSLPPVAPGHPDWSS